MKINLDHSDLVMTLNERQRNIRSACREWLSISFSLDAMDTLMENQANALIGEPAKTIPAGMIWIQHTPISTTIIESSDFQPRRSLASRYALAGGASMQYQSTYIISFGGTT